MNQVRVQATITRQNLKSAPDVLFVFGDNMQGRGYGGQAKQMRGEPNAVGIPTKWAPSRLPTAYFCDQDLPAVQPRIDAAFQRLIRHLKAGGTVVLPLGGVGSGLAELPTRAPAIYAYIQRRLSAL